MQFHVYLFCLPLCPTSKGDFVGLYEDVQLFVGCLPFPQPVVALANVRLLKALCVGSCPVVHKYCDFKTFKVTKSSYIVLIKTSKKKTFNTFLHISFLYAIKLFDFLYT